MIVLWDIATQQPIHILTNPKTNIYRDLLTFSPDSRFLASSSEDLVTLWDVTTGVQTGQYKGSYPYFELTFSPDGRYLAASDQFGVNLWDISSRQQEPIRIEQTVSYEFKIPVVFSLDSNILFFPACGQTDNVGSHCLAGEIRLWDIKKNQLVTSFSGPTAEVTNMTISPDGDLLAISFCSPSGHFGCDNSEVTIWYLTSQTLFYQFEVSGDVKDMVFSADGKTIILASSNRVIIFWDISWVK
jgi:WD40 repeat protein